VLRFRESSSDIQRLSAQKDEMNSKRLSAEKAPAAGAFSCLMKTTR
jgi:hypothetical protein